MGVDVSVAVGSKVDLTAEYSRLVGVSSSLILYCTPLAVPSLSRSWMGKMNKWKGNSPLQKDQK
jgi:hypothetical protein